MADTPPPTHPLLKIQSALSQCSLPAKHLDPVAIEHFATPNITAWSTITLPNPTQAPAILPIALVSLSQRDPPTHQC